MIEVCLVNQAFDDIVFNKFRDLPISGSNSLRLGLPVPLTKSDKKQKIS